MNKDLQRVRGAIVGGANAVHEVLRDPTRSKGMVRGAANILGGIATVFGGVAEVADVLRGDSAPEGRLHRAADWAGRIAALADATVRPASLAFDWAADLKARSVANEDVTPSGQEASPKTTTGDNQPNLSLLDGIRVQIGEGDAAPLVVSADRFVEQPLF